MTATNSPFPMHLLLLLLTVAPSLAVRPKLRRPAARRPGSGEAGARGENVTRLTFGEMVTIYHDIWNTMLIGHSFAMGKE